MFGRRVLGDCRLGWGDGRLKAGLVLNGLHPSLTYYTLTALIVKFFAQRVEHPDDEIFISLTREVRPLFA